MPDIGVVVSGVDVQKAAMAIIGRLGPTYLGHVGEQAGLGGLAPATVVGGGVDLETWPSEQLPVVVVSVAPVTSVAYQSDRVDAQFLVAVGVVVSAPQDYVRELASYYLAAIRSLLVQNHGWPSDPSHGLDLGRAEWLEESYDVLFEFEDSRSLAAGRALFSVWAHGVVSLPGAQGPGGPGQEWTVQSVEINTTVE